MVAVLTYQDIETTVEPRPIPLSAFYPGIERFLQYPWHIARCAMLASQWRWSLPRPATLPRTLDGVAVAYDPLPAIVDVWQSLSGDVLLFEEHGTNLAYEFASALGDVDEAFRQADYTRKETFRCHRHTANPWRHAGWSRRTLPDDKNSRCGGDQGAHFNRGVLAAMLQMPEHRIHFIEPDVGGASGCGCEFYPENFLIPFAARQVGRPVKWIEDRREHSRRTTRGSMSASWKWRPGTTAPFWGCARRFTAPWAATPAPTGRLSRSPGCPAHRPVPHSQLPVGREVPADEQGRHGDVQRPPGLRVLLFPRAPAGYDGRGSGY